MRRAALVVSMVAATALAAGCGGGSGGSGSGGSASGTPVNGGTLRAGIPDNPDYLDPGLSYTNEGWEILEATNNGLVTFKKAAGGAGAQIVPDIASAMPAVTDGGRTYTFHVRPNVMFSPPVSRAVKPSDFKFSIERLFRVDSGGLAFFTGIQGADAYAKTRKGGISGIVANDAKGTITFHLTQPDGTFLDYMATPFAFVLPTGTPSKDISTLPQWRIATGPYRISSYTPKQQLVMTRNPNFHQWTPDSPGRPSELDLGHDRDHARAVGERDRRRPARLVLRVGAARPADRAQGPLPEPGAPLHAQQHHLLLDERAPGAVQQAGRAPGRELRHRRGRRSSRSSAARARRPRTSSRPGSARPSSRTTCTPTTCRRRAS